MKTRFLTDSTFYIDKKFLEDNQIEQIPLIISIDDKSYIEDQFDLNQKEEIFNLINEQKKLPKTSQPTLDSYLQKFKKLEQEGAEKIYLFTVSEHISGTIQGAYNATNIYMQSSNIEIKVYDIKQAALAASLVLMEIIKEFNKNQEITDEKIEDIISWYETNAHVYLLVDDLKYLAYGGRIPSSIAKIGNVLKIKPIIKIEAGKMLEFDRARTRKKAIKIIEEQFLNELKQNPVKHYFGCEELYALDDAKMYQEIFIEAATTEIEDLGIFNFGPTIGAHVGPNTLAFLWAMPYELKND